MQQQLRKRLQQLKAEFEVGQKALADTEAKARELRDTLLRISGAIQVLEEELATQEAPADEHEPAAPSGVASHPNGGDGL